MESRKVKDLKLGSTVVGSVNGIPPDENGDVRIQLASLVDATGLEELGADAGLPEVIAAINRIQNILKSN